MLLNESMMVMMTTTTTTTMITLKPKFHHADFSETFTDGEVSEKSA